MSDLGVNFKDLRTAPQPALTGREANLTDANRVQVIACGENPSDDIVSAGLEPKQTEIP